MNPLVDWLDEWVLDLRAGTVLEATVTVYTRAVRQFLTWLGTEHPEITEPGQIKDAIKRGIQKTKDGTPALLEFITEKATDVSRFP